MTAEHFTPELDEETLPTAEQVLELSDLPELDAPEIEEIEAGPQGWRGFIQNRRDQLNRFSKGLDNVTQKLFSADIDGIHFTARQMLAARFHPKQLAANVRYNTSLVTGGHPHGPSRARNVDPFSNASRHAIIDNPVLREAAYEQAIEGNENVRDYLSDYDREYGKTDIVERHQWKETLAALTGYTLGRKMGLYAIAGVTVLQARAARGDTARLEQLSDRIQTLDTIEQTPVGMKKALKHKASMDALAQQRHVERYSDPFDF